MTLLNPSRGFMIEKAQPFTKKDVDLVKLILDNHDEAVIGIGSAEKSHEEVHLMTAGERMEVIDYTLQNEGITPDKYIMVPVEDNTDPVAWVSEVMMMTPRWDTFYTRNFMNAANMEPFAKVHGFSTQTVEEQKIPRNYFAAIAAVYKGDSDANDILKKELHESTGEALHYIGIQNRARVIFNRENVSTERITPPPNRTLFLGGLQPLTGVYNDGTGHIGAIKEALNEFNQVVIALGSAQQSHLESDPLEAGKRLEVIRYSLMANGVNPNQFYIVPVRDVDANASFAAKVISQVPAFSSAMSGNDWTKQLFGHYPIKKLSRSNISEGTPLSATHIRNLTYDYFVRQTDKDSEITQANIGDLKTLLSPIVDLHTLDALNSVGFYERMKFLAHAKE